MDKEAGNLCIRPRSGSGPVWSAYFYCGKMVVLNSLAYTVDVWIRLGAHLVLMLGTFFLWRAAYTGVDQVEGVGQSQMLTYAIISILMSSIYQARVENTIQQKVGDGDIAIDMMRPLHPLGRWLAEDVGAAVSACMLQIPPLLILAAIFMHVPLPASLEAFLVFLPMCVLSFLINWLLAALVGMIAFWTIQLGHIGFVRGAVVRIMSGALVPVWFFPEWFQRVVGFTPFPYMYQAPIGVFIGRTPISEVGGTIIIQVVWTAVLLFFAAIVWRAANRRILVQGG